MARVRKTSGRARKPVGALLSLLSLAAASACDRDAAAPRAAREGDAAEAAFLAVSLDGLADRLTRDVLAFGGRAGALVPESREFSFTRTWECPAGGTVTYRASGERTRDRDTRTAELRLQAEKVLDDCAFERRGLTVTTDGRAQLESYMKTVAGELVALERHTRGETRVERSDGEVRECTFQLDAVYDPATRTVHVTGTVCGRTVDETRTVR